MDKDDDDIEDGEENPPGIENERALFFRLLEIIASDNTTDEQRLRIYEAAEKIAAESPKLDEPDTPDNPDTPDDGKGEP